MYLKAHKERMHNANVINYQGNNYEDIIFSCAQCDYVTKRKASLKRHKVCIHAGNLNGNPCEFEATQVCNLKLRKASIHEGIRYPCEACNYTSTTAANLKQHKVCRHEWAIRHNMKERERTIEFNGILNQLKQMIPGPKLKT